MIASCVFQCLRVERVADSADSASGAPDETQIRIIQIIRDGSLSWCERLGYSFSIHTGYTLMC